jgi:hypothetical protein
MASISTWISAKSWVALGRQDATLIQFFGQPGERDVLLGAGLE